MSGLAEYEDKMILERDDLLGGDEVLSLLLQKFVEFLQVVYNRPSFLARQTMIGGRRPCGDQVFGCTNEIMNHISNDLGMR